MSAYTVNVSPAMQIRAKRAFRRSPALPPSNRRKDRRMSELADLAHELQKARECYLVSMGTSAQAEAKAHLAQVLWDDAGTILKALRLAAARPDREGWQDISTAPKDGTTILGWWISTPNNCSVVWWSSAHKAWRDDAGTLGAPTKWQAIVPPPVIHEQP
jgi:hypothetical protein